MRAIACVLIVLTLAAMPLGCASDQGVKGADSGAPSGTQAGTVAATKPCVMQSGGRDVLRLTVPAEAKCVQRDGMVTVESRNRHVQVWLVSGARTVDEAVGRVEQQITDEFKEFKTTNTASMTVAGMQARKLSGTGVEADDSDPGTADVVVFTTGKHVFIACTHGEHLSAEAQQLLATVLQSAKGM